MKTANFENGTNGAGITTGGTGDRSPFSTRDGVPVYSNTHAAHGSLSAKFDADGQALRWDDVAGVGARHYSRVYVWTPSNPSTDSRLWEITSPVDDQTCVLIGFTSTGKLRAYDSTFGNTMDTTASVALGQWVRIEVQIIHSATVGQVVIRLYNDPESTTVTEELSSPASWNTRSVTDTFVFGWYGGATWQAPIYFDAIAAFADHWPGPWKRDLATDFEGGTNTMVLTPATSEYSGDAFDGVIGSNTYSSEQAAHGSLSAKSVTNMQLQWTAPASGIAEHYGRVYMYVPSPFADNSTVMITDNVGIVFWGVGIQIAADGSLDFTTAAPLNSWFRLEWHIIHSLTVGQVSVKLFLDPDSTTPDETKTTTANKNLGTSVTALEMRAGSNVYYLDDLVAFATDWVGPAAQSSPTAPQRLQPRHGGTGRW